MKNYYLIFLLLNAITNLSCTSLQYRKSDTEIKNSFNDKNFESKISYFSIDSLKLKVRIQSVVTKNRDVNLIFLHGSPSSLSAWESYLKDSTLTVRANMYAVDRPGYGYSNFGKELTSINTQAKIISEIINQFKLTNVIAIGTSYGGPIAARLPIINTNIKGVVIVSPALDPENEKIFWAAKFTQWKLTRWLVPTGYRVAGDEKKVHAKELKLIEKDWKNINVPIIHIHGMKDKIVPFENTNFSSANFRDIKIISIPTKGHEIAWEHKELVLPSILELINRL